jgi:2-desacetyl-2-hydroxyethyl bacteriochlorophyllide A dehydrogenase
VTTARAVWITSPMTVELRHEAVGELGPNEVRLRAIASAISHGTEMLVYRGRVPRGTELDLPTLQGSFDFPIKYGYASVGRIDQVGASVTELFPGELAFALHPHQDVYVIPETLVHRLPAGLPAEHGLFFANVETALNAMLDEPTRLGECIVVFGQGIVGLVIGLLARRNGARRVVVVDRFERRRQLAIALGADAALKPGDELGEHLRNLTDGRGADLIFEASGSPTALQSAIDAIAPNGTVVVCSWYGTTRVSLELGGHFHRGRVRIRGSQVGQLDPALAPRWDRARRSDAVVDLLSDLPLDGLVSHRIPFEQAADAYHLVDDRAEETVQVVLTYPTP